jgi:outer membrane protein TolC
VTGKYIFIIGILVVAGCSADWYRQDADLQVDRLLTDRKQTTLGYTPKTVVSTQPVAEPTQKSYAKIPTTPIPPPAPSVMEPARYDLNYEPLGPPDDPDFYADQGAGGAPGFQTSDLQRESTQRLRLGPPAAGPQAVVQLDLFKAIEYGVHNSRDYQTQMEDMYTSTLDVLLERHAFELRPFATSSIQYVRGAKDSDSRYRSALEAANTVGVRQRLPYGGEVTARALVNFVDALNDNTSDGETSEIALSGTIPLMRGAGMVNLEPLIQSERDLVYRVRAFETFRRQFAVNIAQRYFNLLTQQQAIVNRRLKYISSTNLTERTRELYAAGRINFLQVQQALQEALRDEDALVGAEERYENSLDDFKIFLGMPMEQNLDVQGVELDVSVPDIQNVDVSALALKYRLELQTDRDRIEDARRRVDVRKNGLLPDLNLTADAGVGNRPNDAARDVDSRQFNYSVGANMDWPLDRVAERNEYRRSLIDFSQAQRQFDLRKDQILADTRADVRALRSAQISYDIQRRSIDLAQRRLEYSNELLIQGKANSRDVVDSQTALLASQDSFAAAKADLQVQVLFLLRDMGVLRLDPAAGSLGHAMDFAATNGNDERNPSLDRAGG